MAAFLNLSILSRNRNFALLYTGQFVSFLGTMITGVALPYQIYMETHSTLMVGLLSLFQLLPLLVTALVGGVFADRYHRRFLLLSAESVLALGSLMLAINAYSISPNLIVIFLLATTMSAFNGLHRPALDSIVQQIVAKKDLPAVSALGTFKFSVCMIIGPAVGGLMIAYYGIFYTYLADFASFAFSLFVLALMRDIPKPMASRDESTFSAIKKGFTYALSRQELVGTYVVDFVAMVFGMPQALFPAIAVVRGGPKTLGLLYAAPAVGALGISIFSGWLHQVKRHGVAIALSASLWGAAIIGFGFSPSLGLGLFFLMLAGAFDALSGMFRMIMWNETIPHELRGRLAGIEMLSYLSGPRLGDTEAGLVAAMFGITVSIVSGGFLCIVSVILCSVLLPKFWRYRAADVI